MKYAIDSYTSMPLSMSFRFLNASSTTTIEKTTEHKQPTKKPTNMFGSSV
jgi:hypothetical protein